MKTKLFSLLLASFFAVGTTHAQMEGKKKSPAAETVVTHGDAKVTINYSQPSMRGLSIKTPSFIPLLEVLKPTKNHLIPRVMCY